MANINEEYQFENYLVECALPMMLQDPVVRPSLILNAIFFIGEDYINAAYNCFIDNKKYDPSTGQCNDPTPPTHPPTPPPHNDNLNQSQNTMTSLNLEDLNVIGNNPNDQSQDTISTIHTGSTSTNSGYTSGPASYYSLGSGGKKRRKTRRKSRRKRRQRK